MLIYNAIWVSEMWFTSEIPDNLVHLCGYDMHGNYRQRKRIGGVSAYILNFIKA